MVSLEAVRVLATPSIPPQIQEIDFKQLWGFTPVFCGNIRHLFFSKFPGSLSHTSTDTFATWLEVGNADSLTNNSKFTVSCLLCTMLHRSNVRGGIKTVGPKTQIVSNVPIGAGIMWLQLISYLSSTYLLSP